MKPPAGPHLTRSIIGLQASNLDKKPRWSDEFEMKDDSDDGQEAHNQPRKRAAIGDSISARSGSPYRQRWLPVLRDAMSAPGLNEKTSSPRYRRGRGRRQEIGVNGSDNPQDPVIHPSNSFPSLLTMLI